MTFKNNTIIAGNLVKDMEIIETNSLMSDGSPFKIGKGTLAINQSKDEADFISFEVTGWVVKRILDANKHLKGSNLGVSGVLVDDTYEKDGKTRHNIKVKGDDVMFGDHFMGSWNQVTLYAHVAQNPESKQSANGTVYARFNIANAVYDMRKKESVSSFFRAVAFGAKAEFIKDYFKKGDALMVQGRLSTSKAESSQPDGTPITYYNTELIVENIRFAQRKSDGVQKSQDSGQIPNQNQNQNVQPNQNGYNMSGNNNYQNQTQSNGMVSNMPNDYNTGFPTQQQNNQNNGFSGYPNYNNVGNQMPNGNWGGNATGGNYTGYNNPQYQQNSNIPNGNGNPLMADTFSQTQSNPVLDGLGLGTGNQPMQMQQMQQTANQSQNVQPSQKGTDPFDGVKLSDIDNMPF